MTSRPICEKCSGSGLVSREGPEADKDQHPIISTHKMVCPSCGGSGMPPKLVGRRQNIESAQKLES